MFQIKSCGANQNTLLVFSDSYEIRAVFEIMCKKYCRTGQATDGIMALAHCMLDT
jgi:hypothetical protein